MLIFKACEAVVAYDADSTNPSKYDAVNAYEDVIEVLLPFKAYDAVIAYDDVPNKLPVNPEAASIEDAVIFEVTSKLPVTRIVLPNPPPAKKASVTLLSIPPAQSKLWFSGNHDMVPFEGVAELKSILV